MGGLRAITPRTFQPVADPIRAALRNAANAPSVALALILLNELAGWHRNYLEYLRYYDQRREALRDMLKFWENLELKFCPAAIQDKVAAIIADLSSIPIQPTRG